MMSLDDLLQPLSPLPAGPDLRLLAGDVTFHDIRRKREALSEADSPSGQPKHADWHGVINDCERALKERTKDLDLACLLTEALVCRSD